MIKFKEGDKIVLISSCVSGMHEGTYGTLVRNCGHKRGKTLHFHMDGVSDPHANRAVCRNEQKWEFFELPKEGVPYHFFRRCKNYFLYQLWTDCRHENYHFKGFHDDMVCDDCGAVA
jgi:hypothetical protein